MFTKSLFAAALAAIGVSAFGFDQPAYDATYTTNGITYAQRGGLGMKDFVITNIDAEAVSKVKSVNGRVGDVVLDAAAVNALPDGKDELVSNENFKDAVKTVSPPVELPQKWALANVTNANGKSVRASDVGALGNTGSQTLNQSYGGLSVNFDAKGELYTGQYAPSKWSITEEINDQYHYVQFFGFNGTNYPSFNLFDGESDFYIRLPRKEGTLALQSDVESKADSSALTAHTENTSNPHAVTAEQAGAVPLVEDKNGNKTAVTIGSRKSSEPVGSNSLANGIYTTASGPSSHAEGNRTTAFGHYSHAEGYSTTAFGHYSHAEGYLSQTKGGDIYAFAWNGDVSKTEEDPYKSHGPGTFNINPAGGLDGFYIGEQTLSVILLSSVTNNISATNPTFSSAVLAVNLDFTTNTTGAAYVAVTNALAGFGFDAEALAELPGGKVYGSIGALLAALAAAAAWLKKNKVQTLKLEDNSVETSAENGVAKLDDFFTESNSLLNARITYSRNETGLKDRAFNTLSFDGTEYNLSTALAAVTQTASGQPRDLLIVATATAATTISFTAGTIKGDKPTIDGSGTWLITLTEYASGVWYCRQIKMEDAA